MKLKKTVSMESIMKIQKFQTVQSLDYSEMILMITWQNVVPDGYVIYIKIYMINVYRG